MPGSKMFFPHARAYALVMSTYLNMKLLLHCVKQVLHNVLLRFETQHERAGPQLVLSKKVYDVR